MRIITLILLTYVSATNFAHAASSLCQEAWDELLEWHILPDNTLQIILGQPVVRPYSQHAPEFGPEAFTSATFLITEKNISAIAAKMAPSLGISIQELTGGLHDNLAGGHNHMPLELFLPARIRSCFGTCDIHSCYQCAFNFNEAHQFGDLNQAVNLDPINKLYPTLSKGNRLQYGDILLFRTYPSSLTVDDSISFHAAVYMGGDVILHKYAPGTTYYYEFSTLRSVINTYSNPLYWALMSSTYQQRVKPLLDAGERPFIIEMKRYQGGGRVR